MPLISLFSNNFPAFFIVERDGLADIAKIETNIDRGNATFEWTGPNLEIRRNGTAAASRCSDRLRAAHRDVRRFPHARQVRRRYHGPRRRSRGS